MKVIKNTFPQYPNCAHGEEGDICHWELVKGAYSLIRDFDSKLIFRTANVDKNGCLRSNGKSPVLCGIIAQNKSKGYIFILEK